MRNKNGYTHWVVVILISVMAVSLVYTAWWYEKNKEEKSLVITQQTTDLNLNSNTNVNTTFDTSNWLTYTNVEFGFSFGYPSDWKFNEAREFCFKEDMQPGGSCVNLVAGLYPPAPFKNYINLEHAGQNKNNLTINEWRRQVAGRRADLENSVDMGDFEGLSLENISEESYQNMAGIYFLSGRQVFNITWYDGEQKDEGGYKVFIEILKSFKKI